MKIVDLTEQYLRHMVTGDDLSAYAASYPSLFEHYFKYWGNRKRFTPMLSEAETRERSALIRRAIDRLPRKLNGLGLAAADLKVVLFVGQGSSNGHAFKDNGSFVVWIPVETYRTEREADVFTAHEIAHALHYTRQPSFYFENPAEQRQVSRRLITEGVATYLSMRMQGIDQGEALWADFLSPAVRRYWLNQCHECEPQLRRFILSHFTSSDPEIGLFYANKPDDIFHYRAGYFVGLRCTACIVRERKLSPPDLLDIPRKQFELMALDFLTGCPH